jgi:uncharacterized protein YciI
MRRLPLPPGLATTLLLLATLTASGAASAERPTPATTAAERDLTLVYLKTGPQSGKLPEEEQRRVFQGHFENMARMAREGQLVLAGPFGDTRHDAGLRGLFVLDTGDRARAETWASTDPPTRAGVFVLEYHDLATAAPLAACRDADLAWRDELTRAGKEPGPGEGARPYVLLTVEDGARAREVLAPKVADGSVLLLARLDATRALAVLDAEDVADARARLGATLDRLGDSALDDWYATGRLVHLADPTCGAG